MAEALVSKVLGQHQQAEERIRLIVSVDQEMEKLTSNFQAIQAVLMDAEKKQVKENAVGDWLVKLRDISYDVDDVLDEWNTTIQKLQIKKVEDDSELLRQVCSRIPYYLCCCRKFILRCHIAVKMIDLDRRLDIIAMEKDRFQFSLITEQSEEPEQQMTTSFIDFTEVHGRDEEMNRILDLLLSESSHKQVLSIISIVGIGGIGKTTLARSVFNDEKVENQFDEMIWVCVSKRFDEMMIAKAILESLRNDASNLFKLETILENLRKLITGKKFLIVLDDVWAKNSENWKQLKNALMCGSQESRVLVTTRQENVANVIGSTHNFCLELDIIKR